MNTVEEGVANFRSFQAEARDFFSEQRTKTQYAADLRKEFRGWIVVLLTLLGIIIGFLGYFAAHAQAKAQILSNGGTESAVISNQPTDARNPY